MSPSRLPPLDTFVRRHLGSSPAAVGEMLDAVGAPSLEQLVDETVPSSIRLGRELEIDALGEGEAGREPGEEEILDQLRKLAHSNSRAKSLLGLGYHGTIVPGVL